jgi:hypothetical protein
MNLSLMPSDINVDFYFYPIDIYKSDEDIKCCYYNTSGSAIAIVTKTNNIKIYDFMGKIVMFTISHFKENEMIVSHIEWIKDSRSMIVVFESNTRSGFKLINFDFDSESHYELSNEIILEDGIIMGDIYGEKKMILSGKNPCIYNLEDGYKFYFLNAGIEKTVIVKELNDSNSFLLFIKDMYLIFVIREINEETRINNKILFSNLEDKKLNEDHTAMLKIIAGNLSPQFMITDAVGVPQMPEILNISIDISKSLILINSTDRILRLFKYDAGTINYIREFFDSVNRKKWINAYFFKIITNNNYNDVIVCATSDVNSLEVQLIDINTGNSIRRLDPFKFNCHDFICHYTNHWSLVMVSNKKLFHMYGYLFNNWGTFAPQFKYIEENIEYIEEESFFDNFNQILKKTTSQKIFDASCVKNVFYPENKPQTQNLFFKYKPVEDQISLQSEKDLKEVFHYMNELIESTNNK